MQDNNASSPWSPCQAPGEGAVHLSSNLLCQLPGHIAVQPQHQLHAFQQRLCHVILVRQQAGTDPQQAKSSLQRKQQK